MKAFLKSTAIVGLLILPIMYGCANDNVVSPSSAEPELSEDALAKRLPNQNQKIKAIRMAEKFLLSEGMRETNAQWASSAVIVDAFPVYMDGVDEVCYYECKVISGGKDAGYIMVNINKTDLPFPSYSTEGKTATEEFSQQLGIATNSLQVFRHNWFEMLAEKKSPVGLGDGQIAIERGFDGSGSFNKGKKASRNNVKQKRIEFINRVKEAGGVNPQFTKQILSDFYTRDSIVTDSLEKLMKSGGLSKTAADWRWTSDELNNTFATGWHLPKWTQVKNTAGNWSGCGPLALAMMYAYHRQFTGKAKLFNGLDLNGTVTTMDGYSVNGSTASACNNRIIYDVVFQIGADCGADYGSDGTGVSINALENDGELYGDRLGYDVHLDVDYGGDFTKGKNALGHIRGERPCMFQFDSDRNGSVDHYGAIEGVKYKEKKNWLIWYNWEMWYLVNYGWGNKREWICVDAQYGSKATEYKNTGNLYMEWR